MNNRLGCKRKTTVHVLLSITSALLIFTATAGWVAAQDGSSKEKTYPNLTVSGYLQTQAFIPLDTQDDGIEDNSAFSIKRLRLRFRGEIIDKLGYTVMIDPSTINNLVRDAFISLKYIPHHEIRLGQMKTLFGYENPESSTRLYTVNRAYASDALGRGKDARDIGVGLFGDWDLPDGFGLEYGATLVNGAGPNTVNDDTARKNVWGRAGVRYKNEDAGKLNVRIGGSFGVGNYLKTKDPDVADSVDTEVDFLRYGADLVVDTDWFHFSAEFLMGNDDLVGGAVDKMGFFATAVGFLPYHFGIITRFDQFDPNVDKEDDLARRAVFGAMYDVDAWRARLIVTYEKDLSETEKDDRMYVWAQVVY
ncbi:MAG: hypothetical protein HUU55_07955 [Myxococcales bacterium]|nr:hypothetical protein [Myxococcales bacterium]